MKKNAFCSIALALVLVLALGCFTGCKSTSDNGVSGVLDTNGVAGSEIEVEIPQGGNNTDDTDNKGDTVDPGTNTETPGTDTETPGTDTETPGTDTETPGTDTETPGTDTETPGTDTETPDDGGNEIQKPAYDESKELVVVSYNIKCGWYGKTFEQIVSQIKAVDADIVGFQEVDYMSDRSGKTIDQVATIAGMAGYPYFYFEPVIELGKGSEKYTEALKPNLYGHAVMSKYPITKSEIVWPDAQNSKEGTEVRNFGRHEIDVDGTTVVFYNGHLDGTVGREQYFELQEEWMNKDEYAICVGDFNETYSEFQAYFDYDKYYSFAFGPEGDSDTIVMRGTEGNKSQVIDHIIVTKDKFVWKNGGERDNGYYVTEHDGASDHNMIYCYLNIIK